MYRNATRCLFRKESLFHTSQFLIGKIKYRFMKSTKLHVCTVLAMDTVYLPSSSSSHRSSSLRKQEIIYKLQEGKKKYRTA